MAFAKVRGGVIGGFTPVEVVIDFAKDEELATAGEHKLGVKVPAGRFVYGAFARNQADDLAGTGPISLNVGDETELSELGVGSLKGDGTAKLVEEPLYVKEDTELVLDLGGAMTAGKLNLGVIYG